MVVTRVRRRGGGRPLRNAGKLDGSADYTTNRRLTFKGKTKDL